MCPCPFSHLASLPASVVFPPPYRPANMITVGGVLANASCCGLTAEDADEFVVDNLDDLLGRIERTGDLRALGTLLDPADEVAHHG